MSANLQDIVATAATAGPPEVPIEHRIRAAYFKARQRPGALATTLDAEFSTFQARLGQASSADTASMSGVARAAHEARRVKLMHEAEAHFTRWAEMPDAELSGAVNRMLHPPAAPVPLDQQARSIIAGLTTRGIRLELWHKTFRASPASKLDRNDKGLLQGLKAHVLAELQQRADAWSPE